MKIQNKQGKYLNTTFVSLQQGGVKLWQRPVDDLNTTFVSLQQSSSVTLVL